MSYRRIPQGNSKKMLEKTHRITTLVGKIGAWESYYVTLSVEKHEQYKSLDPAARIAKLLILGLKEADDPFTVWIDSIFKDSMTLW